MLDRSLQKTFSLKGKVALVTGAGGLLGREHCNALASAGATVCVVDSRMDAAKDTAEKLRKRYRVKAEPMQVDVSSRPAVRDGINSLVSKFKRLDVLINNAALTARGGTSFDPQRYFAPFEEYPIDIWEKALSVNLTGVFLMCQAVGAVMRKQNSGSIINIGSAYGIAAPDHRIYKGIRSPYGPGTPLNTPAVYSATKAGVLGLTKYLAGYWAGTKIRVNMLTPSGVQENHSAQFVKNYSARTMMGRMSQRDEYRGAVVFLASEASSYMTGANLIIDGGLTAW